MATYHVEMRSFPRALTLFNQSGQQLGAILLPWVQDKVVELDDEKWAPWESTITIVEGPPIPLAGLSMGRGWSTAKREGTDVTDRVVAEARQAVADGSAYAQPSPAGDAGGERAAEAGAATPGKPPGRRAPGEDHPSAAASATGDGGALGVLLGAEPDRLLDAWHAVAARTGGLAPSESLALAERELRREGSQQA